MIQVRVAGLLVETSADRPILLLTSADGEISVPVHVGLPEATAIASELEGVRFERPKTHDLLLEAIRALGGDVAFVALTESNDDALAACISIDCAGDTVELQARPADAIAVAVRARAPIFASRQVISEGAVRTSTVVPPSASSLPCLPKSAEEQARFLEALEPEDFGEYEL